MQNQNVTRKRTQYSSCDECRRRRVACDASKTRNGPDDETACGQCRKRGKRCTFLWMTGRRPSEVERPPVQDEFQSDEISDFGTALSRQTTYENTEPLSRTISRTVETPRRAPADDSTIPSDWLLAIYKSGFESVFGTWLGKFSNPFFFGDQSNRDMCVSISDLCTQLDAWKAEESQMTKTLGSPLYPNASDSSNILDELLHHAIEAYAARWLPLIPGGGKDNDDSSALVQHVWRRARKEMLMVINRPSYRSMLALLLFAYTPIPAGISDEEELDGVSGQVCVHAALQQIQVLRARQRSLSFNGSRVEIVAARHSSTSPNFTTNDFINAESTAYWAALTFDTSASLTLNCRPLLSSGLFGYESETCWKMVRSCSRVFQETVSAWTASKLELTDEKANQVIAAASTWKLLQWKLTANFKESLRDGHSDFEVRKAFDEVSIAIDDFDTVYKHLLIACYNRIHYFPQETKLRWYVVTMHYHLCILMLVDIAEATERQDLLERFETKRSDAESWVMNCLKFGLANRFTMSRPCRNMSIHDPFAKSQQQQFTASFIAVDPYAHHVVASVKLMQQAIDRDLGSGKLPATAYHDLQSTFSEVLSQLPQGSKSVQVARASVLWRAT